MMNTNSLVCSQQRSAITMVNNRHQHQRHSSSSHLFTVVLYLVCLLLTTPIRTTNALMLNSNVTLCVRPYIVNIELSDQMRSIDEKGNECRVKLANSFVTMMSTASGGPNNRLKDHCPIMWDKVMCWPETKINDTVYLPCPDYVSRFNTLNKASKHCEYDPITAEPHWSKTNFNDCLTYKLGDYCNLTSCSMENHMSYIIIMRVVGYVASMFTLVFSIIILLRPKLRCPRNYVHINLFVAFALRTVLVMVVDQITRASPFTLAKKNASDPHYHYSNQTKFEYKLIPCRTLMVIFRYSGSVYHTAILAEALYLVLLLKYPYYNEMKGSKFCILFSWLLPIIWMIPWTLTRAYVDNYWCWQAESELNLIIKIPHSLLLILNIACAVFIIRILYSKMRFRNFSKEKIRKYRRLAKSILILIPIFGLHFTFFAWLPYTSLAGIVISDCLELVFTYIETFFNAFQGFVVSLTTCLIHHEVRIELILFAVEVLKKIKCLRGLRCMDCLDSDYIRQMRYFHLDPRAASSSAANIASRLANGKPSGASLSNGNANNNNNNRRTSNICVQSLNLLSIDEESAMLTSSPASVAAAVAAPTSRLHSSLKKSRNRSESTSSNGGGPGGNQKKVLIAASQSQISTAEPNYGEASSCCFCLFGNQKNDFFRENRSSSSLGFRRNSRYSTSEQVGGGGNGAAVFVGESSSSLSKKRLIIDSFTNRFGKKQKKTVTMADDHNRNNNNNNSNHSLDNHHHHEPVFVAGATATELDLPHLSDSHSKIDDETASMLLNHSTPRLYPQQQQQTVTSASSPLQPRSSSSTPPPAPISSPSSPISSAATEDSEHMASNSSAGDLHAVSSCDPLIDKRQAITTANNNNNSNNDLEPILIADKTSCTSLESVRFHINEDSSTIPQEFSDYKDPVKISMMMMMSDNGMKHQLIDDHDYDDDDEFTTMMMSSIHHTNTYDSLTDYETSLAHYECPMPNKTTPTTTKRESPVNKQEEPIPEPIIDENPAATTTTTTTTTSAIESTPLITTSRPTTPTTTEETAPKNTTDESDLSRDTPPATPARHLTHLNKSKSLGMLTRIDEEESSIAVSDEAAASAKKLATSSLRYFGPRLGLDF